MNTPFDHPEPRQVEPGEYPALDEALALLNRDVAATLPAEGPLGLMALPHWEDGEPENVYVTRANGEWWGNPVWRGEDDSAGATLSSVADAAQDTITERLWQAWPVCTLHGLGMHLSSAEDGSPAWLCVGKGGDPEHVRALVGELDTIHRPHRPNRKRKGKSKG
ncbi:hypothetical protein ACQEWB_38905 [Streptomyces sp. CA-249302]|uniref:hypothetical protein n=1 Tax=Streptomyces sp. CA-249302 TaxID=3240058 RepID=UPI003D8B17D2